jgi:hypothetical protein
MYRQQEEADEASRKNGSAILQSLSKATHTTWRQTIDITQLRRSWTAERYIEIFVILKT